MDSVELNGGGLSALPNGSMTEETVEPMASPSAGQDHENIQHKVEVDADLDKAEYKPKDDATKDTSRQKKHRRVFRYDMDETEDEFDRAADETFDDPGDNFDEVKSKQPKFLNHSMWHMLLTAQRLKALEKEVMKLKGVDPSKLKIETGPPNARHKPPKSPVYEQTIAYLNPAEWKHTAGYEVKPSDKASLHNSSSKTTVRSVLEVLKETKQIQTQKRSRQRKGRPIDREPSNISEISQPEESETALVTRNPERLRIRSASLLKLLEELSDSKFLFDERPSVVFLRPFKVICDFETKIRARLEEMKIDPLAAKTSTEEGSKECSLFSALSLLVKFLDTDLAPILKVRKGLASGSVDSIAFADLWHLFAYGQEVRKQGSENIQMYRVVRFQGGREALAYKGGDPRKYREVSPERTASGDFIRVGDFLVDCVYYDFDGTEYFPRIKTFSIRKYDGERKINELPIYPVNFDKEPKKLRDKLLLRGNKFIDLMGKETIHRQYTGQSSDTQEDIDSQIIIDHKLYYLNTFEPRKVEAQKSTLLTNFRVSETVEPMYDPDCDTEGCCGNDYIYKDYTYDEQTSSTFLDQNKHMLDPTKEPLELDTEDRWLLPPYVHGFVLRSRTWQSFDIDFVTDLKYSNGFDDLVLPHGHKESVQALVKNHLSRAKPENKPNTEQTSIDLVRNKGKGLIILLHGEPGVGKTSTAECIADYTKRPLFPITCGDIGDNAFQVEKQLEKNFQLAHTWNCVLLLDEADVFLQNRDRTDLQRNAIVSVFLRALEYYSGILFLTTNRVGAFDAAFKSRIHISLFYPNLDWETTRRIWEMHLTRVAKAHTSFTINREEIMRYAEEHFKELQDAKLESWNGRQIRNAFQTAIALAEFDAESTAAKYKSTELFVILKDEQFRKVAAAAKDFDKYLKATYGGRNQTELAAVEHIRAPKPKTT